MASNDLIEMRGVVSDTYRGGRFKVITEQGMEVTATPSGKIRINNIKIVVGDEVTVEVSPCDLSKGRITRRE